MQVCTVCEHVCLCMYCSEHEPLSVFVCVCMRVYVFVLVCCLCMSTRKSVCLCIRPFVFMRVSLHVCDDEAVGEAMLPLPFGLSFLCVQGPSLPPTPLPLSYHITTVYQGTRVWEFSLFTFSFSRILICAKNYRLEMRGIALRAFSFSFWKKKSAIPWP